MPIYIHRDGQQFGPFSVEQARDYLESGNLVAEDLAWFDGAPEWMPLGQIPGLLTPAVTSRSNAPNWVPPKRETGPSDNAGRPAPSGNTSALPAAASVQPASDASAPVSTLASAPPAPQRSAAAPAGVDAYRRALRSVGIRNMGVGGLFFGGGSAVTVISYEAAQSDPHGGTYVMAWGAIIFGGIQFVKGLIQFCKA